MKVKTLNWKRIVLPVAIVIALILANSAYIHFSASRKKPFDKREWINSTFAEIRECMTIEQVHQFLGQDGDFRVNREENDVTRFALYEVSHHGMLYTEYWNWEEGSVAIAYSEEKPRRVIDKGLRIYQPRE